MAGISGLTQLVGLIGWPVAHSFSPAMHNAAAAAAELDWAYVPLPVRPSPTALEAAVRGLAALGFRGANVTVPHKQAVIAFLDDVEREAAAIGAVNTIVVATESAGTAETRLLGYNTDWSGLLADLAARSVVLDDRDCLVLGAGGSARAVAFALATGGGRVCVLARRPEQAQSLVDGLSRLFEPARLIPEALSDLPQVLARSRAPLIVNTTPLGMAPNVDSSPWPPSLPFPAGSFAYDLVYNPQDTRFLQQAQASGARTAGGLGMLAYQGAQAFRLWTGLEPDLAVMTAVLRAARQAAR